MQCETVQQQLLALLRAYLTEQSPDAALFEKTDWSALRREAELQTVSGFICTAAARLPADYQPDAVLFASWQHKTMTAYLHFAALFAAQQEFCTVLQSAGVPVCIWKGFAAAAAYPEPELRTMGDVDALVPAESMNAACAALLHAGYTRKKEHADDEDMHLGFQKDGMVFEVHRSITACVELPASFLQRCLDAHKTIQTAYGDFPVLGDTAHACAMLLHMLRHFISSGFGLRQLYDWAFWLKNVPINAEKVLELARVVGAELFLYAATRICTDWFGLHDRYGWAERIDRSISDAMLEDILIGGNWGFKESNRTYSLVFTMTEGRTENSRPAQMAVKLNALAEKLCPWTRRYPAARPLLWGPVCVQFMWRVSTGKRSVPDLTQAQNIAARRNAMFVRLGLSTA
ncbi:MAG: nucleotidyltransferase family protein, partial [Butyricicoccus sp.]